MEFSGFIFFLAATDIRIGQVVLIFGMVSGLLGVLYALGKRNIKRLLAYSSVENIGIILIGAGLGMIGVALGNHLWRDLVLPVVFCMC